uniref:hypothetical protein n=1 Tax=Pseudomonas aeruginosa TaxID=287 RepID=UPI00187FF40F|nr:hypothetical protein [Pseudomonas aeruginosa]
MEKLGWRDRRISPDSGSLFQTFPKQTANGSPWTASFTGESVEVIYPYSDEDDYRMTKHDLLKVIQESSNVQKAEIAVEGVKVTYSCQHPVTKS